MSSARLLVVVMAASVFSPASRPRYSATLIVLYFYNAAPLKLQSKETHKAKLLVTLGIFKNWTENVFMMAAFCALSSVRSVSHRLSTAAELLRKIFAS
jgi:hypothetical protein